MASENAPKMQYHDFANKYASAYETSSSELHCTLLEISLVRTALTPCSGLRVLDLGGGAGLHARSALSLGAARVDVVDISEEMLDQGTALIKEEDKDRITWTEADATHRLWEHPKQDPNLGPTGSYDIVMANWVFDHSSSMAMLRAMWANVGAFLQPAGRFLGVRCGPGVQAPYMLAGKCGIKLADFEAIGDGEGLRCRVVYATKPPFHFEATMMWESMLLKHEVAKEMGLGEFKVVPFEENEVVKKNPEYWREMVENPETIVVTAMKVGDRVA